MGVLRSLVNLLPPPVAQAIREARAKRREETRRERVAEASSNETLTNFWWEHGRAWAEHEAGADDLNTIASLARRIELLGKAEAESQVTAELEAIWRDGFQNSADAFGWNDMNDQLPAAAMVAFVKGAGSAQAPSLR